ncbi:MAG: HD-GYP domain-containing protein [Oscillospiraceae bacterium]
MDTQIQINLGDILQCLSKAQSILSPMVGRHQEQVAYLSYQLATQLNVSINDIKELFLGALVHDIGALSIKEKIEIIDNDPFDVNTHAFRGANLIREFDPLRSASDIVRYHHLPWDFGKGLSYNGNPVPVTSHILHLADRVCVQFTKTRNVLTQVPIIMSEIEHHRDSDFMPEQVDALMELSKTEYIWLDLMSEDPTSKLPSWLMQLIPLGIDDLIDLAKLISHVIDFASEFTSRHSAGVAKTAERLAELANFSPYECKVMLIAGYLHDLGKLAIDNDVLEKPAMLNADEFNEIRSHTYYTYYLLDSIPEFSRVKSWAAYHHERIDGNGYPFHIKGDNLSLGSRIMAVADVFTAITEDRPYRIGMENERAIKTLKGMVSSGSLDRNVVDILLCHFDEINTIRAHFQHEAEIYYKNFFKTE